MKSRATEAAAKSTPAHAVTEASAKPKSTSKTAKVVAGSVKGRGAAAALETKTQKAKIKPVAKAAVVEAVLLPAGKVAKVDAASDSAKPVKKLAASRPAKTTKKTQIPKKTKTPQPAIEALELTEVATEPTDAQRDVVAETAADQWNWHVEPAEQIAEATAELVPEWLIVKTEAPALPASGGREFGDEASVSEFAGYETPATLADCAAVIEPLTAVKSSTVVGSAAVVETIASDAPATASSEPRGKDASLLERRLANVTAKKRRPTDASAKGAETAVVDKASLVSDESGREAKAKTATGTLDTKPVDLPKFEGNQESLVDEFIDRRIVGRRASDRGNTIESEMRTQEQQHLFNETALWMRKGGMALIGLNALIVIAVLVLWRAHPSQSSEMKEMQKAAAAEMTEMRRATAASEVAAYAACLGSQTARGMLLQMKPGAAAAMQVAAAPSALQQVAETGTGSGPAQLAFDVEKTTSVNVHVPVLFHIGVQNTGSSSALNARVWGAVKILDSSKEPDFRYDEIALEKKSIQPGEPPAKLVLYTTEGGMVAPLKDTQFQRVSAGADYLVAYGKAVYEDVFGVRHWTEFCHNITAPAGVHIHTDRCTAYNGSGVSELPERLRPLQRPAQNASVTLPEIACVVPKDQKY